LNVKEVDWGGKRKVLKGQILAFLIHSNQFLIPIGKRNQTWFNRTESRWQTTNFSTSQWSNISTNKSTWTNSSRGLRVAADPVVVDLHPNRYKKDKHCLSGIKQTNVDREFVIKAL
jgi:hypothetical protein